MPSSPGETPALLRVMPRRWSAGAVFGALFLTLPAIAAEFNVADYGARGDGRTVDTAAIQRAIDASAKAAGSVIVLKPGVYLTGSVFLKTGTHLRLDEGVELRGVQDDSAYPMLPIPNRRHRNELACGADQRL